MKVPFLNLEAAHSSIAAEIEAELLRVARGGPYVLGPELERFETAFADYLGAPHCAGLANGLDALRLGLMAMGIGPGDEVIVPANTYIATWLAVSPCGATPVPVQPRADTSNIAPDGLRTPIT